MLKICFDVQRFDNYSKAACLDNECRNEGLCCFSQANDILQTVALTHLDMYYGVYQEQYCHICDED